MTIQVVVKEKKRALIVLIVLGENNQHTQNTVNLNIEYIS